MDKQQREFIATYFRKRNMITNPSPKKREAYETRYILGHPEMFDIQNMTFASLDWLDDIIKHPEKIEEYNFKKNDPRFQVWYTMEIMKYFPQFFELLNFDKIHQADLAEILVMYPDLIDKTPKDKLDALPGNHIAEIIKSNPKRFLNYFDLSKITDKTSIKNLITAAPELSDRFDLSELTDWDVFFISRDNPEIIAQPVIMKREDYKKILEHVQFDATSMFKVLQNPRLFKILTQHVPLNSYIFTGLISKYPESIKIVGEDKFKSSTIVGLIAEYPELRKYFNPKRIKPSDYYFLLSKRPELHQYRSLSDLHMYHVKELLKTRPELIKPVLQAKAKPDWDEFTYFDLSDLREILDAQPSLGQYLKKYISQQRFMHEQIGK